MQSYNHQQQLLQQTYKIHSQFQLRLKEVIDKGVALRREAANLKNFQNLLMSNEYLGQVEEVTDLYEGFSAVRQQFLKMSGQDEVDSSQIQLLKLENQAMRCTLEKLQYQLELQESKERVLEKEESKKMDEIQKLLKMTEDNQQEWKRLVEQIQESSPSSESGLRRELNQIMDEQSDSICSCNINTQLFQASKSITNLSKELQQKEIDILEQEIYLNNLKKSHDMLERKYRKVTGLDEGIEIEQNQADLQEELQKLQIEEARLLSEEKKELEEETQISLNIQGLAAGEAMKKTRHYLFPKITDIAKKRKAIEHMLKIIKDSTESEDENVKNLKEELEQCKKWEDSLHYFLNSSGLPEFGVLMHKN